MRFLLILGALLMSSAAQAQGKTDWKLVIHGGAGTIKKENITPEKERDIRAALDQALAAGAKILGSGGSALDAVEASVKVLEDDPNFNAGRGSVFTYNGHLDNGRPHAGRRRGDRNHPDEEPDQPCPRRHGKERTCVPQPRGRR
jgi:hypothetical protein